MTQETVSVERSGFVTLEGDVQQAMLPSECPQNHAANLLPLPHGDVLCCLLYTSPSPRDS